MDTVVFPIECETCGNTWIDDVEPEICPHCNGTNLIINELTLEELDELSK